MNKEFTITLPEYNFEKLSQKEYENDRNYPENFSNWYPHIKDFGDFKHVDIVSNQIFTYEETKLFREEYLEKVDVKKLNDILKPTLDKMELMRVYSIKNGSFSNKFNFETCLATKQTLAQQLWKINYEASVVDCPGFSELVVRKLIPHTDSYERMTIYNGMPLRNEIRVFYDMDTERMEYFVDYWDYDYCFENINNISDKIVFDYFHGKLSKAGGVYTEHKDFMDYVATHELQGKIKTLKFDGKLKGIWSIDFLVEDRDWYLIDMARGFKSAYWNPSLLKGEDDG